MFPTPRIGDRVRLLPGCRTSIGTAGPHDVGEVTARLGQSTIVAVRMQTPTGPQSLFVECHNVSPTTSTAWRSLWSEAELREAYGR